MSDLQPLSDADVFGGAPTDGAPLTDADVFAPAQLQGRAAPGAVTRFAGADSEGDLAGQFAVVDLGDITASHDTDLHPSEQHDAGTAFHERQRRDLEQRVAGIVRNFDPVRLGAAATAAEGAPVVGEDGQVEDGNVRAIALGRIYTADGQKAEDYRQFLREQAPALGIDPAVIDDIARPVLVRVRTTPADRAGVGRPLSEVDLAPAMRESSSELASAIDAGELDLDAEDLSDDTKGILSFLASSADRPDEISSIMTAARSVLDGKVSPEDAVRRYLGEDEAPGQDPGVEPSAAPGDRGSDPVDPSPGQEPGGVDDWQDFPEESGHRGIAREDMPQIKAGHRGALTQFLLARGIPHEQAEVPAEDLKPTQARWSVSKVAEAANREGGERSILVSADGHVLDGHHQWLAALSKEEPVRVIRFAAPLEQLLEEAKQFPSAELAG